ncbi:MAG: hypothetical protein LC637_10960 [Xanthomonadaceae bacterium]|nr:hypothetical protein [Xanthomonadaceae bacterium]
MLKNTVIVIVLSAGIFGSLLFYLRAPSLNSQSAADDTLSQPQDPHSVSRTSGDSNEPASNTSAPNTPGNSRATISEKFSVDNQLEIIRQVTNAINADAYFDALSSIEQINPELAAEKRRHLDDFCSDMMLTADTEAVREKRQAFCNGYLASARQNLQDIEEFIEERATSAVSRINEDIDDRLKEARKNGETTEVFTRLVLESRFPEQIHALIGKNTQGVMRHRIRIWRVGEEVQVERYPNADLLNAQTVALHLYQCAKFGGCGSYQYFAVIYCQLYLSGRCAPTASVEEMLYQTTPPADFSLANEILSRLLNSQLSIAGN